MYKFAKIEKLIEKEIPKLTMPTEFGEAPAWNPQKEKIIKGNGNRHKPRKKPTSKGPAPTS
jgi:hypothetical protein